jgi:hypothetical protein
MPGEGKTKDKGGEGVGRSKGLGRGPLCESQDCIDCWDSGIGRGPLRESRDCVDCSDSGIERGYVEGRVSMSER